MKSIIKQPLVHFLLVGFVFFLLFNFFNKDEALDSKTVVVDKQALMNYFQYQSQAFNQEVFEQKMAAMPKEELEQLIKDYVREEVLYREAKAMRLDKEDFIIKRRMIQKVEFISQGIAEAGADLSEDEISTYKKPVIPNARLELSHPSDIATPRLCKGPILKLKVSRMKADKLIPLFRI